MRSDILPLCDHHFRAMEFFIAPFNADYSVEFFRCPENYCGRCFSERLGYVLPKRDEAPVVDPAQPRCQKHGSRMFICSLDRQRNTVSYACPEPSCPEAFTRKAT
jgi:hypothetical protein